MLPPTREGGRQFLPAPPTDSGTNGQPARSIDIGNGIAARAGVEAAPQRFVYVLRSLVQPSRCYVGLTSDVRARLVAHNAGLSPHTSHSRPWKLRVAIEFEEEAAAIAFEKYLKSGSGRAFAMRRFRVPQGEDL